MRIKVSDNFINYAPVVVLIILVVLVIYYVR